MKPNEQPILMIVASQHSEAADHVERALTEIAPGQFVITRAASFAEIYSLLNESPCDVLLVDWHLRGMSLTTITGLRQSEPTMATVIFITPQDTDVSHKIVRAGAEECVCVQNLSPKDLRNLLRNAAQRHKLATESEARITMRCQKLEELVPVDEASGFHNATSFDNRLEKEVLRSTRYGSPFTLVVLEVDDYSALEDTYGPRSFLTIIRLMSDILRTNVRRIDEIGRIGKARFGIICVESTANEIQFLAKRILGALAATSFNLGSGITVHVSVSIGIVEWTNNMPESRQIMQIAATALAKAKSKGKGNVATSDGT